MYSVNKIVLLNYLKIDKYKQHHPARCKVN